MTYKHLEEVHELRMWIATIIIPATAITITLASNQNVRGWFSRMKIKIKSKFHKQKNTNLS